MRYFTLRCIVINLKVQDIVFVSRSYKTNVKDPTLFPKENHTKIFIVPDS